MSIATDLARSVEGFMFDDELELLAHYTELALDELTDGNIVEVGSYLGRSTVAIAGTLKDRGSIKRVIAIDPHEGDLGLDASAVEHRTVVEPTWERFVENLRTTDTWRWV